MTWRSKKISQLRASRKSSGRSLPKPDLEACIQFEKAFSSIKIGFSEALIPVRMSLFVSPSGKIYGDPDLDHAGVGKILEPDSGGSWATAKLQESGFIRIYLSDPNESNMLGIKIETAPTSKQMKIMNDLEDTGRHAFILVGPRHIPYYSLEFFREAYP